MLEALSVEDCCPLPATNRKGGMRFAQKSPFAGISPLGMTGRIHQGKVSRNAGIGLSLYARYPGAGGRNASGKASSIAGMSGYALVRSCAPCESIIERMMVNLSIIQANLGNSSQI